jgi:hypothetical protein
MSGFDTKFCKNRSISTIFGIKEPTEKSRWRGKDGTF